MKIGDRLKIVRTQAKISQAKLAELSGLGSGVSGATRISNYENNTREPNNEDVLKITKALSKLVGTIDPGWLQFGTGAKPLFLGEDDEITPKGFVQILNWNEISDSLDGCLTKRKRQRAPMFENKCSEKAFALRIKGDAMQATILGNPSFLEGDVIIVDPEQTPSPSDFVIAQIDNKPEPIIRQLIEDQGERYLKPMNHQYPLIEINDQVKILAKLVAHIKTFD